VCPHSGAWVREKAEKGVPLSIKIKARTNESVEQLLRLFKKICEKEGLNKEIKRNSYYEKPSERRRRKLRKAMKRLAQRQAELGH